MVKHILADGREVESIDGKVIPTTGPTEAVYRIALEHAKKNKAEGSSKSVKDIQSIQKI